MDERACPLSITRLLWLQHLARSRGECRWEHMPRSRRGRAVSNLTWRPMIAAGLIAARFDSLDTAQPKDWLFSITDAGRAAIAAATGGTE